MTMNPRTIMALKLLANRYHQGSLDLFTEFLPSQEVEELKALNIQSGDLKAMLKAPSSYVNRIHYSWILPLIKEYSAQQQQLFISALPDEEGSRIAGMLNISKETSPLPSISRRYLLNHLLRPLISTGEVQPLEFLGDSPFAELLTWDKKEIMLLIDYLGLFDLAEKSRNIVDKTKLKNIFNCLSPKKIQFMRSCSKSSDQLSVSKLNLDDWSGDCRKLHDLIHLRGLFRLGKALCGERKEIMWHLTHILDTGRAKILNRCYSNEEIENITPILRQQVFRTMNHLKPKEER